MNLEQSNLSRLLQTKKTLGLSARQSPSPSSDGASITPGVDCVNCGYSQAGQRVDRCPECGLPLASRLRDATGWSGSDSPAIGWWQTASRIWLWDRRTRIRTAFVPTTPESRRFAKWSVLMSAPCLGLALAVANQVANGPRLLTATYCLWLSIIGTVFAGLLLCFMLFGLSVAIRGIWRRRLCFVPSSVHYACAWWPPVALAALTGSLIQAANQDSGMWPMTILSVAGLLLWGLWLWGSATEAQHVSFVAVRIAAVTIASAAAGFALLFSLPGHAQRAAVQLLASADDGLLRVKVFGTLAATPSRLGPQTYALFIDMIPSDDEGLILNRIDRLGAGPERRVLIQGKDCKLENIEQALLTARTELRPEDGFILYINGHGAQHGSGSIRMADGEITSQRLADLLSALPTARCLVVIDSCFGGKFLPALSDRCNATVIAATDDRNVAFKSGLRQFWSALVEAEADLDRDGRVTVNEAFWAAYRDMLEQGEMVRRKSLRRSAADKTTSELMAQSGAATPQLVIMGKADKNDFATVLPTKTDNR